MKLIVVALAVVAAVQADIDWSQIRPKNLYATPVIPPTSRPRIVGGQPAQPHQFPHQVGLIIDDTSFCGGTIIREDVILTAAHCVDTAKRVKVVAGAHFIQQTEDTQQIIDSTKFIIHTAWNSTTLINDIALVILPTNLTLDYVTARAINLRQATCPDAGLELKEAIISGWGKTSDSSNDISPVLAFTTNRIISNEACNNYYDGFISTTHVCIDGIGRRGACNGDSGGPLTVGHSTLLEEVGIASFVSNAGCEAGYPTVYTRVSCFKDWIQSNMPK